MPIGNDIVAPTRLRHEPPASEIAIDMRAASRYARHTSEGFLLPTEVPLAKLKPLEGQGDLRESHGFLSQKQLILASRVYEEQSQLTSWWYVVSTFAILVSLLAAVLVIPSRPLWPNAVAQLTLGLIAGLIHMRVHALYHDYLHGAILKKSALAAPLFSAVGFYLLSVPSFYRENHNFHHQHNGKLEFLTLDQAKNGPMAGYPMLTVDDKRRLSARQYREYELGRHPLHIVFAYFIVTLLGWNLLQFKREPRKHWGGAVAPILHFGMFGLAVSQFGLWTGLCAVIFPAFLSRAALAYLFFVQHNYPDAKFQSSEDWSYTFAALHSSSMFDMSPLMHWLTGNEGYHHVHHLNHNIPFYRLPEAMKGMVQLQNPGRTSWRPRDIAACFAVKVWSPEKGRMLTAAEAESS